MFDYLKQPRELTPFELMRGTIDFGNLVQFNMYEGGYAALFVIKMPTYLTTLAEAGKYTDLINNYKHILERDFKSLSGISDITADALDVTDGIDTLQVIGKVTMQPSTEFTLTYQERSGSPITRLHEVYLRGIRDPRGGQVKHYHGLIEEEKLEAGYENETFTLLYINTDNTMRKIEKAYLILSAWITDAKTSIYEYTKGDVTFKDVDVTMNGYPITSDTIDQKAQEYLNWLNSPENPRQIIVNSEFGKYSLGLKDIDPTTVDNHLPEHEYYE